jgi:hypothetical protein
VEYVEEEWEKQQKAGKEKEKEEEEEDMEEEDEDMLSSEGSEQPGKLIDNVTSRKVAQDEEEGPVEDQEAASGEAAHPDDETCQFMSVDRQSALDIAVLDDDHVAPMAGSPVPGAEHARIVCMEASAAAAAERALIDAAAEAEEHQRRQQVSNGASRCREMAHVSSLKPAVPAYWDAPR